MFRSINIVLILSVIFVSSAECQVLKRAKDYEKIEVKVIKTIPLPRWYHEGLFYDGNNIWVCNGQKGKIWVVDPVKGSVVSEITPVAAFTEGIARSADGRYFVTDWVEKKLYRVKIDNGKMAPQSDISFEPAHPAGVAFAGKRLFVITWQRGLGTKFNILEVDDAMFIVEKIRINDIQEPCQMAWDGHNLWITSWFYRCVYKVDMDRLKIVGQFSSPVAKATGIAWDGKYLWMTGTYADLYQLEVQPKEADPMNISVTSGAFKSGEMMPGKYTCDGEELSPPLAWSGIPAGTKSIALISDDPDAPRGDWVHWVMFNIPPETSGLPEGIPHDEKLENGAIQGRHDGGGVGYGGPYPPSGTHRYYFKVYALDTKLALGPDAAKKSLLKVMEGHILAQGELMGRYKRR
ncbi:MAG: YbhB/YbcL family Raf kinase inhibitor-like protein [Candidatus Omnitrophica bacterium]|nr:YbhB/YbcL family Raf kinase inhibitor-like protein [Candidatus Omnitrophota bacterium]